MASSNQADEEEDYIDIEVNPSSNFSCQSISKVEDFEFQMCSVLVNEERSVSPADELFYNGKLLPLHLQSSSITFDAKTRAIGADAPTAEARSESCRLSREPSHDECFFERSMEDSGFVGDNLKKSRGTRLKQMKHSSLSQKLEASRAYVRSLFSKSACSHETCAKATNTSEAENRMKIKDFLSHRRSFSGATQRQKCQKCSSTSTSSSGSSSFSFRPSGNNDLKFLKRCSSADLELENSVAGAIAHCKQSQQIFSPRKIQQKDTVRRDQQKSELSSF